MAGGPARYAPTSRSSSQTSWKVVSSPAGSSGTGTLDEVPDGYPAMNDRDVLKFQIDF
jgi:hypothetical protein